MANGNAVASSTSLNLLDESWDPFGSTEAAQAGAIGTEAPQAGDLPDMPAVPRFQTIRRGYDPAEVDKTINTLHEYAFASARTAADAVRDREAAHRQIAQLDGTVRGLRDERSALQDEVQRLHTALQKADADLQTVRTSGAAADADLIRDTLLDARRFARDIRQEAERVAGEMRAAARREADEARTRAQGEAQGLLVQAREQANRLMAEAGEEAGRIRQVAARTREAFLHQVKEMEQRLLQAAALFTAGGQGAEKAAAMVRGLGELPEGDLGMGPGGDQSRGLGQDQGSALAREADGGDLGEHGEDGEAGGEGIQTYADSRAGEGINGGGGIHGAGRRIRGDAAGGPLGGKGDEGEKPVGQPGSGGPPAGEDGEALDGQGLVLQMERGA